MKLDAGQKHILKLVNKGRDSEGWARVSEPLFPHIDKNIPKELVELEKNEDGSGRIRLTEKGKEVVSSMEWI